MKKHNLISKSVVKGRYLLFKLNSLRELKIVGDVRGLGLMAGVELVENKKTREPFSRKEQIGERVVQAALRKGLNSLFGVGYTEEGRGDAIMIAPPFIVTKKEIDKIVKILKESILEVQNSIKK